MLNVSNESTTLTSYITTKVSNNNNSVSTDLILEKIQLLTEKIDQLSSQTPQEKKTNKISVTGRVILTNDTILAQRDNRRLKQLLKETNRRKRIRKQEKRN